MHTLIATPETSDSDMHVYACVAVLNHMILKKPQDATVFIEFADSFAKSTPNFSLENRYLHFLARHAHTPNQTTFNSQIVKLTQEKVNLSSKEKNDIQKRQRRF